MSRAVFRPLKQSLSRLKHLARVARGAAAYRRTGVTPEAAYQSLIALHCQSNGRTTDWLHGLIESRLQKYEYPSAAGVLGKLSPADVARFVASLNEHGYCVFPGRLAEERCAALERFARCRAANVYPATAGKPASEVYDSEKPAGDVYRFDEQTLLESAEIQRILADYSLLSVAQEYLGCPPVIDIASMWWSVPNKAVDDARKSSAAQLYHFDMDRVKWLKVFVYLTDVDAQGGPHCFVAGSHRSGSQPEELRRKGYARISDREIQEHYPAEKILELTGKRGTMLAVDTRAYHKGKAPETHDRLVAQFSYCDSLFGSQVVRPRLPAERVPELEAALARFPRSFQRYLYDLAGTASAPAKSLPKSLPRAA